MTKLKEEEIHVIRTNLDCLSEIEWTSQNDEKLNYIFFTISDVFEKKLKRNDILWDWRKIEICFQRRALTDKDDGYPNTRKHCLSMIETFIKQF